MPGWVQSLCVGGWFTFLLLWCLPKTPVSSIPPLLFLVVLFYDWGGVKNLFRHYRIEIGLVMTALVLGIVFSSIPHKSLKGTYDFLRGGLIFFPTILLTRARPDLFRAFLPWGLGIACIVFLTGTLAVVCSGGDFNLQRMALLETYFGHYNHFGAGTAMVAIMAIAAMAVDPGRWPRIICLSLVATLSIGMTVFSGSRGSVLAFLVVSVFLGVFRISKGRWMVLAGGVLLVAGFLGLLYTGFLPGVGGSWSRPGGFTAGRFEVYSSTLYTTWEEAKYLGFGINTFKNLAVGQVLPFQLIMPHSFPVEMFFSLGLVGSVLFLISFFGFGWRIVKESDSQSSLLVIGGCVLVFVLARGTMDLKFWSVYFPGLVSCGLGLLLAPPALKRYSPKV